MDGIEIRQLKTLDELKAVEALQRAVWDAPTTVIYLHMLVSIVRNGGSILGAMQGNRLVGFLISFLGTEAPEADRPAMANLKLVSQRMAVLPEFRDSGLGYELKLAQRRFAVGQGIRLITWTFDPLLSRNAHLNIRKLGAVVLQYFRDYYGTDDSPLVRLHSSDRVLAEWWITSNRVEQRIGGKRQGLTIAQYLGGGAAILNPTVLQDGLVHPCRLISTPTSTLTLIEIPSEYDKLISTDPDLAVNWRQHSRLALELALQSGYVVTDFVHGTHEDRARSFYVLTYLDSGDLRTGGFSSN